MRLEDKQNFLSLVRLGIGHRAKDFPHDVNWEEMMALADAQGLSAIVLDGLNAVPSDGIKTMPKPLRLEWIGKVVQMEVRSNAQSKAAASLGELFHNNGIATYVLKGPVIAECYPHPNHRLSADLDCFLLPIEGDFDAWSLGDSLVKSQGYEVREDFYKNSTFHLPGLMVENHQFMTPFRGDKKMRELEELLQGMMKEDVAQGVNDDARFEGTWLYRPPVMVSALFMIEHAYSHFLHEGLTCRMVLDWKLFCKQHQREICWTDFESLIKEFGFKKFYDSYSRLGDYIVGEFAAQELTGNNRRMLEDLWAPLDLHESRHWVKAKVRLAGNYWRARWKYKYFTDTTWLRALLEWVTGALFDRHPKLG